MNLTNIGRYNFEQDGNMIKCCNGEHASHEACNYTTLPVAEVLFLIKDLIKENTRLNDICNKRIPISPITAFPTPATAFPYPPPNKFKLISTVDEATEDGIYYLVKFLKQEHIPYITGRITEILSKVSIGEVPMGKQHPIIAFGDYYSYKMTQSEIGTVIDHEINPLNVSDGQLFIWGNLIRCPKDNIILSEVAFPAGPLYYNNGKVTIGTVWAITCLLFVWLETSEPSEVIKVGEELKSMGCITDIGWRRKDFLMQVTPIASAETIIIDFTLDRGVLRDTYSVLDSLLREKI